jgi:hypothetical protein
VIREQDRRKVAAIPSTGIDYFSLSGMLNIYPHFDNDETPERTESEQEE